MDSNEQALALKAQENQTEQWQRISPIAMVYFLIKFIFGLANNIVYLAPALIIGYKQFIANPHIWLPIGLGLIALLLLSVLLSFYYFQYRLSNGHIEIRSGVVFKKYINLPFTRIQNVKLEQPIYYRPFNYTCLQLDTAGSNKQEAKVVALKLDFAEQLKAEILASHKGNEPFSNELSDTSAVDSPADKATEQVLNTRSLGDLVIHGLTNNRIWIFFGAIAPFIENIGRAIQAFFNRFGINIEKFFVIADKAWWQVGLLALTITFMVMAVLTLFSVAGSIISFYNYSLSKSGDRYIRRSGLLTKHEVTMRLARLQMVVRQQDWLDVLLKRINLKLEQSNAHGQNFQPGAQSNKIIVPSIKAHECQHLINDLYPENQLTQISFSAISKRFLVRNIGYIWTPICLFVAGFLIYIAQSQLALWVMPVYLVIAIFIYCRWRRWGYAIDDNFFYIRKGMLGVNYYCFPIYKVQQTCFKQSYFLKRHQLSTVKFILAAGEQSIPFIPEQKGRALIDTALFKVEALKKSWM